MVYKCTVLIFFSVLCELLLLLFLSFAFKHIRQHHLMLIVERASIMQSHIDAV